MKSRFKVVFLLIACFLPAAAQKSATEWGAPAVTVSHDQGQWIIAGRKNRVILDEESLAITVMTSRETWKMVSAEADDILIRWQGGKRYLSFSDAGGKDVSVYKTGYRTGVKIRLQQFHLEDGEDPLIEVVLTLGLEGEEDELVFDIMAIEKGGATVRRLDWPKEVDTRDIDFTVLNHVRGNLLPCDWPHPYHPFRTFTGEQEAADVTADTTSVIVSNLVECWSQSWWGFERGEAGMMLIVETPDDASYKFSHPAGGPTVIGPRWLASLGHFSYPRTVRMVFFDKGNYVTMAKRYRKYVQDIGQFVSLKEKIARNPLVEKLIGAPHYRQYALITGKSLRALPVLKSKPAGQHYDPEKDYGLMTFDQLAQELRELKAKGVGRLHATLCGWPTYGYNMRHPDALPPAPPAGGWEGMKEWTETCHELGYTCGIHDQYRDYYFNAASFDPELAIHEEDSVTVPTAFPGSRFFGWKEGTMPVMDFWGGGKMAYLNPRFGLGHLIKNYTAMKDHGIHLTGTYLDVFGYVPPTEDWTPEHPLTRTQSLKYRAMMFNWVRNNLGVTGTEDGADWIIPYVDYTSDGNEGSVISIPLFNLVYHDAIMTPSGGRGDPLRCLLNGGFPWIGQPGGKPVDWDMLKLILAFHKRVALLEMTGHEFLDDTFRKERTTFSDGTTVTIDRDAGTFEINPPVMVDGKKIGKGMVSSTKKQKASLYPGIYNTEPDYLKGYFVDTARSCRIVKSDDPAKGLIKGDSIPVVMIWADKIEADPGDTITFTFEVREPKIMIDPEGKGLRVKHWLDGVLVNWTSPHKWVATPGTHVFTIEARVPPYTFEDYNLLNDLVVVVSGWEGEFSHPGIMNSEEELERIRSVVNGPDPHRMKEGWALLRKSPLAGLDYTPSPKEMIIMKNRDERKAFDNDGLAAYYHALQWVVTEDPQYAAKAIEILNAWGNTCKDIWTVDVYKNLHTDNALLPWLSAAEIIRYYRNGAAGWTQEEITRFDGFVAILKRLALAWQGFAASPFCCQNQNAMVALARMSIGVYQNDKSLFESGYRLLVEPMFGTEDPATANTREENLSKARQTREFFGKPVNLIQLSLKYGTGENMEINRTNRGDIGHMNLTFRKLVDCAELLRHQGINMYEMKFDGENIPRLLMGAEWNAQAILNPPYKTSKIGEVMPRNKYITRIEKVYNAYKYWLKGKYPMPYTEKLMQHRIENGDVNIETLTHAALSKQ